MSVSLLAYFITTPNLGQTSNYRKGISSLALVHVSDITRIGALVTFRFSLTKFAMATT
jgi:hypothetical protein